MSKRLIKDSTIYSIGSVLSRSLSFLLIPLYTRFLTVSEYGSLALLNLILQIVSFVCLLGVSTAAMRFYFDPDNDAEDKKKIYGTATVLLAIAPPFVVLAISPIIFLLVDKYLTSIEFFPLILAVILTGLFTPMNKLMCGLLRVQHRAKTFVIYNISFFVVQSLMIVVAVGVLSYGLAGQIYSQLIANAVFGVIALLVIIRYCRPTFSASHAGRMLRFGIPLIPFFIFSWMNNAAGRFMLESYTSLEQVGIFALAAQFSGILLLLSTALDNALMPHFLERAGKSEGPKSLGLLITRYLALFGIFGLAIGVAAKPIIIFVSTTDYHGAARFVLPLLISAWLFTANKPIIWSLTHSTKAGWLSIIQGASVGLLVVLLYISLSVFDLGIPGIIVSTIAANMLSIVTGFIIAQRYFTIELEPLRIAGVIALLAGAYVLVDVLGTEQVVWRSVLLQGSVVAGATALLLRAVGLRVSALTTQDK